MPYLTAIYLRFSLSYINFDLNYINQYIYIHKLNKYHTHDMHTHTRITSAGNSQDMEMFDFHGEAICKFGLIFH